MLVGGFSNAGLEKMTQLHFPDRETKLDDFKEIQSYLASVGITLERWQAQQILSPDATQEEILSSYSSEIERLKSQHGYQAVDVIKVNSDTPGINEIRAKFLSEHTHSEDEVRFFVEGEGLFWFHKSEVFSVRCTAGDLISVPANTPHWFDLGTRDVNLTAIRLFTNPEGWIANYTRSGIDEKYNP